MPLNVIRVRMHLPSSLFGTLAVSVVFALLLAGCIDSDFGNATLRDYTGLDGCHWVIELDNGEVVEPRNVEDFIAEPVSQMRLLVEYTVEPDWVSICMVGPVVTLTTCGFID